ncbi:hypothetical protein TNCV_2128741 [Trichonephila clavipes]|nr:hypothetical protein TNCV_2128741 [Trichonephila clavipes]
MTVFVVADKACTAKRHGQRAMNMNRDTNAELVDIHFIYGLANGNGRVLVRLHSGNRVIKRSLGCIRIWQNMDLSES